jgi:hypothetical protein
VYQTGSYALYQDNDISIGKIFSFPNPHFRSDFNLRVRVIARGVLWAIVNVYCRTVKADRSIWLQKWTNCDHFSIRRECDISRTIFSNCISTDFSFENHLFSLLALLSRAGRQSADCATLMLQTSQQEVTIRSYQINIETIDVIHPGSMVQYYHS